MEPLLRLRLQPARHLGVERCKDWLSISSRCSWGAVLTLQKWDPSWMKHQIHLRKWSWIMRRLAGSTILVIALPVQELVPGVDRHHGTRLNLNALGVLTATLPTQKPLNSMFIFPAVSGKNKFLEVGLGSSRVWRPRILASWVHKQHLVSFPTSLWK